MNVVVSEEMKRKSKLGLSTRSKNSKVNEVGVSRVEGLLKQGVADRKLKVAEKDCAKEEKFKAAIEAVRLELATLK